MTTELEQEFFKVFGIKPIFRYFVQSGLPVIGTDHCRPTYDLTKKQFKNFALSRAKGYKLVEVVKIYPEITDRKLLEMICILSQSFPLNYEGWSFFTIQDLKEEILESCIKTVKRLTLSSVFANKIQQLFKEEE